MGTAALIATGLALAVDFVARPEHLVRYGPRKARRRLSDRM